MIGVDMSAFLRMLKDFKHASSNSKRTSLAKRFVRGLAISEKIFYEAVIKKLAWPRKLRIPLIFTGGSVDTS
jgi:hypothetical protein